MLADIMNMTGIQESCFEYGVAPGECRFSCMCSAGVAVADAAPVCEFVC